MLQLRVRFCHCHVVLGLHHTHLEMSHHFSKRKGGGKEKAHLIREGLLGSLFASWVMGEHDLHLDAQHTWEVARERKGSINHFPPSIVIPVYLVASGRESRHCRCTLSLGIQSGP